MKTLIAVALSPLLLLLVLAWPSCAQKSAAQGSANNFDAALGQLAFQIAGPLEKKKIKRVIVADLLDPNGQPHPVGRFLADKLSTILLRDYPALETINFSHSQSILDNSVSTDNGHAFQDIRKWAEKMGASIVITGSFAKASEGIGISLTAVNTNPGETYAQARGMVPISEEINTISVGPIPAPAAGILRAGFGGVSIPVCTYCPIPQYTEQAKAAKYEGTVVLQVVITTKGRAANISVIKPVGMGMDEAAIRAVKSWKFRPAVGPDGRPVATLVPIELTFRRY